VVARARNTTTPTRTRKEGQDVKQINLSATDETRAILGRVGNRSRYVRRILAARDSEWRDALEVLRRRGLTDQDIVCTCKALAGYRYRIGDDLTAMSERIIGQAPTDHIEAVAQHAEVALATWTVAREYWAGNRGAIEAIDRGA